MKYSGTLTIADDQGETVYERELTADEMLDVLLAKTQNDSTVPVREPGRQSSKSGRGMKLLRSTRPVLETTPPPQQERKRGMKGCSICHTPGHNAKTCPERPEAKVREMASGRKAFSEMTYDKVRKALETKSGWEIVADMGLEAKEVSLIAESEDYEAYCDAE